MTLRHRNIPLIPHPLQSQGNSQIVGMDTGMHGAPKIMNPALSGERLMGHLSSGLRWITEIIMSISTTPVGITNT